MTNIDVSPDILNDYRFSSIVKDTAKLVQDKLDAQDRAVSLAKPFGQLMKFKSYELSAVKFADINNAKNSDGFKEMLERDKTLFHTHNKPALANNREIFNKIVSIFTGLGFNKQDETKRKKNGRYPNTEWYGALCDLFRGYLTISSEYDLRIAFDKVDKSIKDKLRDEAKAVAAENIMVKREAFEAQKQSVVNELVLKYKLSLEDEPNEFDVLHEILGESKYLSLAHWLLKNRDDWSDGYDNARYGLSCFKDKPQNELDAEIIKDIQSCIDTWDNDGRVFRDTTWNYNELFKLVDQDLHKDYELITEYL